MTRPRRTRARQRRIQGPGPPVHAPVNTWFGRAAQLSVATTAFVLGFHKLDDFDTWWHLAAGRWIVGNGAVPATDTLSHTVPANPWINVHWGFDVLLYLLHEAGGPRCSHSHVVSRSWSRRSCSCVW